MSFPRLAALTLLALFSLAPLPARAVIETFVPGLLETPPPEGESPGDANPIRLPLATFDHVSRVLRLPKTDGFVLAASFGDARLYDNGRIKLVVLAGSFKEMGRQYGALMADAARRMRRDVLEAYAAHGVLVSEEDFAAFAVHHVGLYDERFKDLLGGAAETSGDSAADLAMGATFFEYYLNRVPDMIDSGSTVAAWNGFTADGALVMGRNFDFPSFFKAFSRHLVITVYRPEGGIPTAGISYAGQFGSISTQSAAGLVLESSDGGLTGDTRRRFGERSFLDRDVLALTDQATLSGLEAALSELAPPLAIMFTIADDERAVRLEMSTDRLARREADPGGPEGLLTAADLPLAGGWTPPEGAFKRAYFDDARLRHENLAALAGYFEGYLTDRVMLAILDTSIEDGGATPSGQDKDVWRTVTRPGRRELWLKAPGYMDWTFVDLGRYFSPPEAAR